MCHSRWNREEQRDERFEREVRDLLDREGRKPKPPTPVVERRPDDQPAELEHEQVPTAGS